MREYGRMRLLDVWYSRVDAKAALELFSRSDHRSPAWERKKAQRRNSLGALAKLAEVRDGLLRIVDDPPIVEHLKDEDVSALIRRLLRGYHRSLQDDRRALLDRYRFVDFARKVVGVGSVGTRSYAVLFDSSHSKDPLFLQIKEAESSVLEPHVEASQFRNHGHRVVSGQRLMQSASDIFLGWSKEGEHNYYVRQLRDMKATANLAGMSGSDLREYSALCGWVLARAHARSGDAARISGYLGKGDAFDEAVADFAGAYADQTEKDYDAFKAAVRSGRIPAEKGV
jgi:uncharacterized protein (DUF2252 family)